MERLRKHNTGSSFAQFISQETQTLNKFLQDVSNDLQVILSLQFNILQYVLPKQLEATIIFETLDW